ncbi:MAG: GDP-L-fucose synthase [Cyanobacteria bacterium HKST-UBA04]|nr:GDP-L-fucose synthase [Cyanobacteria bacterium HKST-UBA04]MCA9842685.1 GDP-L-fucose synthase [Cyanobacteria bacterium HKST-UBA03]
MEFNPATRCFVAGHRGLVGSALLRHLQDQGYNHLLVRTSGELDLRNQAAVEAFFEAERPEVVFLAAAKVGGIAANNEYPADFIYDNLMIEANVIHAAWRHGVKKLLFLGSSCIYPKFADQPLVESALLTGALEPTNEPYAIAKIAGIKLCQSYRRQYGCNFISGMPTNLYGPGDNYDLQSSHVLPALLRKVHEAKVNGQRQVVVWGTGTPRREFMHVDDLAAACVHLMAHYDGAEPVNLGVGEDVAIKDLARLIQAVVGWDGELVFDASKPDGTPRKLLDCSVLHGLGFKHHYDLEAGLRHTYEAYLQNLGEVVAV